MHSSSFSFRCIFRLLCLICCIIAVMSYKLENRPSINDRNERAVTEWRFRRNYFLNYPMFAREHIRSNHLINPEFHDNKQVDEMNFKEKKFIIPELMYLPSE